MPDSENKLIKKVNILVKEQKKAKELELSIVNSIPTPIPSTTIPEINIKNLLPEKILQNNTEAGWNKKDINKKWSMSF